MTVLCFALGASFATAQTNVVERVKANQQQMAVSATGSVANTGYKGSIFTKAEGDTLFSTTFSAADETAQKFVTGTVSTAYQVGDQTAAAHGQNAAHSHWYRAADTTQATNNAMVATGSWPSLVGQGNTFSNFSTITSDSPMDGFMVMTMQDQIAAWGGSGNPGNFDSYIDFPAFATSASPVDVRLWQYYRKFNADQCMIDYSFNGGTTWTGTVEFNVRGIDVATNSSIRGRVLVTMPAECCNQAALSLRLRWISTSNSGGAYGYFWILDDFNVTDGPAERIKIVDYSNYDGFYHIMPQGLKVPLCSYITYANTGNNAQSTITGKIFAYSDDDATSTVLAQSETEASVTFDPLTSKQVVIDPLGFMGSTGFDYGYQDGLDEAATGTKGTLPTNMEEGSMGFYYSQLASATLTYNLDTFGYEVSRAGELSAMPENMLWGRDNGVLRKFSRYTEGKTSDNYLTDNPNDNGVGMANYSVRMAYTTGDEVPEGWVIRGVQLVASTYPGFATTGTQIYPILTVDSAEIPDATGNFSIYFLEQDHGAGVHTVAANEVQDASNLTSLTRGNYNVINIQFPNQPELKAKTAYRIGYQLVQPATFALAGATNYYYDLDTNVVRFDTTPGMEAYRNVQTLPYTKILVYDPNCAESPFTWVGSNSGTNIPMMRMIVGPKVYIPNYALTVECGDDYTEIMNGNFDPICGTVDSLAEGSTNVFYIQANDAAYEVDQVLLDGTPLENGDGVLTLEVDDDGNAYAIVELVDVRAHHTLRATTKHIGIDPVAAGVKMKLQPNPATNNVQLSISGVEGMVNYSLLDMSGRVISSARINAESINNIDLSKLAKGAYFVRITSDKFSKVEKLIVR